MGKKKTTEGIEYYAFVENPKPLPENFSLCDGNIEGWLKKRYSRSNNFGVDHLIRDGRLVVRFKTIPKKIYSQKNM